MGKLALLSGQRPGPLLGQPAQPLRQCRPEGAGVLAPIADVAHETGTPSVASATQRSRSAAPARSSSQPSAPTPSANW